jgi:hypothetical protein
MEASPSAFLLASFVRRLFLLLSSLGRLCRGLLDRCGAFSGLARRHLDTSFLVEFLHSQQVTPELPSSGRGVQLRRFHAVYPRWQNAPFREHPEYRMQRVAPIPAGVLSFQSARRPPCGDYVQLLMCISSRSGAVKMLCPMLYTGVSDFLNSTSFNQRVEVEGVEAGR